MSENKVAGLYVCANCGQIATADGAVVTRGASMLTCRLGHKWIRPAEVTTKRAVAAVRALYEDRGVELPDHILSTEELRRARRGRTPAARTSKESDNADPAT